MRFDTPKRKVPLLNRRDQLRLALLIVALGFVAAAMIGVASPGFVERLGRWFGTPDEQPPTTDVALDDELLRPPPADVIVAPAQPGAVNGGAPTRDQHEGSDVSRETSPSPGPRAPDGSRETSTQSGAPQGMPHPSAADADRLIDADRLVDLRDAVALAPDEVPVLLYALYVAREADEQRMEHAAIRDSRLVNLSLRPDFYRGEVIEAAGFIQSIERVPVEARFSDEAGLRGVETYWRVWLLADVPPPEPEAPGAGAAAWQALRESGSAAVPPPVLVCMPHDPADAGLEVGQRVRLAGFFFKSVPLPENTSDWEFQPDVPSAPLLVARHMEEQLIDRSRLAAADDGRLGISYAEGDAFYYTLATAGRHGRRLDGTGERGVGFVQLWQEPAFYRGKLIELGGRCVMLRPIPAGPNRFGIEQYFEAGIFTQGALHPYIVNVLDVPEAMPRGAELDEQVRLTAFFFKKYYYRRADDQTQGAPLLLGYRLRWQPAAVAESGDIGAILAVVFLFVGLLLGLAVWGFSRSDRRAREIRARVAATSARDIEALRDLQGTEPEEHLRELEREGPSRPP